MAFEKEIVNVEIEGEKYIIFFITENERLYVGIRPLSLVTIQGRILNELVSKIAEKYGLKKIIYKTGSLGTRMAFVVCLAINKDEIREYVNPKKESTKKEIKEVKQKLIKAMREFEERIKKFIEFIMEL